MEEAGGTAAECAADWVYAGKVVILEASDGASAALTSGIFKLRPDAPQTLSLRGAEINLVAAATRPGLSRLHANVSSSVCADGESVALIVASMDSKTSSLLALAPSVASPILRACAAEIARVRAITVEAPIVLCLLADHDLAPDALAAISSGLTSHTSPSSLAQIAVVPSTPPASSADPSHPHLLRTHADYGLAAQAGDTPALFFSINTSSAAGLEALETTIARLVKRAAAGPVHRTWIQALCTLPTVAPLQEVADALAHCPGISAREARLVGDDGAETERLSPLGATERLASAGYLFNYLAIVPLVDGIHLHRVQVMLDMCHAVFSYMQAPPLEANNPRLQPLLDAFRADSIWRPQLFFEALSPVFAHLGFSGQRGTILLRQLVIALLHTNAMLDFPRSLAAEQPRCLFPAARPFPFAEPEWSRLPPLPRTGPEDHERVAHVLLCDSPDRSLDHVFFARFSASALGACQPSFAPQLSQTQVLFSVDDGIPIYCELDDVSQCVRAAIQLPDRRTGRGAVEASVAALLQFAREALVAVHSADSSLAFAPRCACDPSLPPHCVETPGFGHVQKEMLCALTGHTIPEEKVSFWWWCEREVLVSRARSDKDCPVCMEPCAQPITLPCGHTFCYLCIKGVSERSRRCAVCRTNIPRGYFWQAKVACESADDVSGAASPSSSLPSSASSSIPAPGVFKWFYQGRNGWWEYDERTSTALEESYVANRGVFELMIAGYIYTVDLETMLQSRKDDPSKKRKMLRCSAEEQEALVVQGISGLLTNKK